jgi:hypothetical protein
MQYEVLYNTIGCVTETITDTYLRVGQYHEGIICINTEHNPKITRYDVHMVPLWEIELSHISDNTYHLVIDHASISNKNGIFNITITYTTSIGDSIFVLILDSNGEIITTSDTDLVIS